MNQHGHPSTQDHRNHKNKPDDAEHQRIVDFLAHYHIGTTNWNFANVSAGTKGNDTLTGSNKIRDLFGFGGDDVLKGGNRVDGLIGGKGNDILTGGRGGDAFIFGVGDGHDVITDFRLTDKSNSDFVRIHSFDGKIKMTDQDIFLDNYARQVGKSVVIELNDNDSIKFRNTELSDFYEHSGNICLWLE